MVRIVRDPDFFEHEIGEVRESEELSNEEVDLILGKSPPENDLSDNNYTNFRTEAEHSERKKYQIEDS